MPAIVLSNKAWNNTGKLAAINCAMVELIIRQFKISITIHSMLDAPGNPSSIRFHDSLIKFWRTTGAQGISLEEYYLYLGNYWPICNILRDCYYGLIV